MAVTESVCGPLTVIAHVFALPLPLTLRAFVRMAARRVHERDHTDEPVPQRQRTESAAFAAAAQGEAQPQRSRDVPLARIDESSTNSLPPAVPPAVAGDVHLSFMFTVPDPLHPTVFKCKLGCERPVHSSGGTGNLGKHLQTRHPRAHELINGNEANKRALLSDLIMDADVGRRHQSSIKRFIGRKAKAPAAVASEARWILWLTMSGVSFNAVTNPLFQWARKGRTQVPSSLTLNAG